MKNVSASGVKQFSKLSKFRNYRRNRKKRLKKKKAEADFVSFVPNGNGRKTIPEVLPNTQTAAEKLWIETYNNLARWHCVQQLNYWRSVAENVKLENQKLRTQLAQYTLKENSNQTDGDEIEVNDSDYDDKIENDEDEYTDKSSSEEEIIEDDNLMEDDDEANEIDKGYLEFLQITLAHQQNLKLQRQTEQSSINL